MIGLATVGLCGLLGIILILGLGIFGGAFGGGPEPAKVADQTGRTIFIIEQVQGLNGTDLVRMDIAAAQSEQNPYGSLSSGGGGNDVRNILLLDKANGTTRTLLPDNSRRIASSLFLPARADRAGDARTPSHPEVGRDDEPPPAYYLLTVEPADRRRGLDVLVGALANSRQAIVLRGIDSVETSWMQSPTEVGLIVRKNLSLHYRIIDIPNLRVVTSRPIKVG